MANPDAILRGILRLNTPGLGHNTKYRLDDATIEVDLSDVEGVDESLEGMPVEIEGRFETRENPELGTRWVLKATSAHSEAFSDSGGPESAPPPSV